VILCFVACALPSIAAAQTPHIIAVESNRNLYEVNPATGVATPIGVVSSNAGTTGGLAIGASNTVYLSSTSLDSLFTLDLGTGAATLVGAYGDSAIVMHGIEYVPATDTLYGVSSHNNGLYEINKTTGAATLIGTSGLTSFSNIGWNSTTGVMYLTNSGADSFYTVDLATGATTLIGPLGTSTNPNGLAFDPDTGTLYMVDNSTDSFYSIDMGTGAATLIGATGMSNALGLAWLDGPIPVELQTFSVE
jgi:DNA-binding beta-propeller fold protein YncE